jgi:hypothetical protein
MNLKSHPTHSYVNKSHDEVWTQHQHAAQIVKTKAFKT